MHISPGEINVYLHISFLYTISLGWCIVMQTSIDAVETHWEHNDSRGGYVQLLLKKRAQYDRRASSNDNHCVLTAISVRARGDHVAL